MENGKIFNETIEFLLWSYFKISTEYRTEKIVECAIERAYLDAVSHVLSLKGGNDKGIALNAKNNSVKLLKELIKNFPQGDNWHKFICEGLVENYKNIEGNTKKNSDYEMIFTYGIAQKWVNMTLKYIYLIYGTYEKLGLDKDFCKYCKKVIDNKEQLHVPIDGIILKNMKKELKKVEIDPNTAWSKINDYNIYEDIQKVIKEYCKVNGEVPIEWENKAWIEEQL